ncbi:nucleotidyltransferase family protein [Colwellia psychrerythraea]|uniref:Nucleotidyl transferase n=1 Tax=Colwellia psychrerythraea TaxID=28229 RepID=A0A099KXR5_COLPS|nr:sugar phosphate nucleotidyltransferase [Colwellia psychrerythraea]KGJ94975.1 Nucleotidyl transferase [Colwellia psychrerythraea]
MTSLVILAAGLGSRFGGNKQLAEFGPQQLTLMEYNLFNAVNAGFKRVIFVIRPELESLLRRQVVSRLPAGLEYDFAYQSFDDLPQGCILPEQRNKPLGTAHALWSCRQLIKASFAVINADDFYAKQAFILLIKQASATPQNYLMVAYQLQNTLSDFGGVNRGLCKFDNENYLTSIEECEQIKSDGQSINGTLSAKQINIKLAPESLISMNCWFFNVDIFLAIEQSLTELLTLIENRKIDINQECYLPAVVMQQIEQQNKKVKVLSSKDSWFGLTYPQDSQQVDEKVTALFAKK